jgi:hypothetical protein
MPLRKAFLKLRKRALIADENSQLLISSLQKLLWRLGGRCGSLEELESQLSGFLFEMSDVSDTLLNFVELCSVVDIFDPITEPAIDKAG